MEILKSLAKENFALVLSLYLKRSYKVLLTEPDVSFIITCESYGSVVI